MGPDWGATTQGLVRESKWPARFYYYTRPCPSSTARGKYRKKVQGINPGSLLEQAGPEVGELGETFIYIGQRRMFFFLLELGQCGIPGGGENLEA